MQYLVVFTNKPRFRAEGMPADFAERMREDIAHLRALYAEGTVRQVWRLDTAERGGVVLIEAASAAEVEGIVARIPFVQLDYNDAQVLPLAPYPGFGGPTG